MCVNPVYLAQQGVEVACHKCWQCIRNKIDDWTGRCVAESQTAVATRSITLTYGRDNRIGEIDHVKAAVLTYSDVQKYLRSLRDGGYKPLRYFVVGEYGSRKGRAHWHIILFFHGQVPLRPLDQQIECEHWPHGWSFWQLASPPAIRYVTKYIAKEVETEDRQYHHGLSKMPPLGDAWFKQYARRYCEQVIAPQDLYYSFEHVRDRDGRAIKFIMRGVTALNFLNSFIQQWNEINPGIQIPNSELVEQHLDNLAKVGTAELARKVIAGEKIGLYGLRDSVPVTRFTGTVKKPTTDDLRRWMEPSRLVFDEKLNVWTYTFGGGQTPWYWAMDAKGAWGWRAKIGVEWPDQQNDYGRQSAGS